MQDFDLKNRKNIDSTTDVVLQGQPHPSSSSAYLRGHLFLFALGTWLYSNFQHAATKTFIWVRPCSRISLPAKFAL